MTIGTMYPTSKKCYNLEITIQKKETFLSDLDLSEAIT